MSQQRDGDDETRLAPAATPAKPPSTGGTATGWLSSSGAIDHGRFEPGALLGGRYRIVGRLGRGGMGEVHRADDLKLGQPVALKFLPPDVDRDPARLTQLHTEVRMARQVSHPNVCRVYDIDEIEGHTFLSMEFVDGEDLASLLRRIGRFPQDRGIEIARQICAGLAAAHDRGVIHRDLKPANVMLDGTGKVRITDFGLAGASGEAIRAGTPAYMAPEQLAGGEVTARSDVYALGLVLYEIFTGQRALDAKSLAELIHKREQSGIVPPTAIVRDLDADIEATIMRCLRPDPASRPASALGVAAGLPGGDPLAAALAAGQTPSPEMVAAAGATEAISMRWVLTAAAWVAVSLLAITLMFERTMLFNRIPTPKPPAALHDRAEEMHVKLGYPAPRHTAGGLAVSLDYVRYLAADARWSELAKPHGKTLVYWYRTSPHPLVPLGEMTTVTAGNPPMTSSGMTRIAVDAHGRLSEFMAVPEPVQPEGAAAPPNWGALFEAAGLPMEAFTPAPPRFVPTVFADERMAWEGRVPEDPSHVVRVEAATLKGRPVSFGVHHEWSRSAREGPLSVPLFDRVVNAISGLILPGLMLAGILLAWHNVRLGRGDRRGALRAAAVVFVGSLTAWMLSTTHYPEIGREMNRVLAKIGDALFDGALLGVAYLGLEPYIRRFSPDSLIGWTRLISGRWRDPQVGRDVLIGISAGLAMTVLYGAHNLVPLLFGRPEPMPLYGDATVLMGLRYSLSSVVGVVSNGILNAMLASVGTIAMLIVLKRKWLTWIVGSAVYVWAVIQGMFPPGTPALDLAIGLAIIIIFIGVILHAGLLATMAALSTHFLLLRAPLTTDWSHWRATTGITYTIVIAGTGLLACWLARRQRSA